MEYDNELLNQLQKHARAARKSKLLNHGAVVHSSSSDTAITAQQAYRKHVVTERREIRAKIEEQENAIAKLKVRLQTIQRTSKTSPHVAQLNHLAAVQSASDIAYNTVYYLPKADSPLNLLLAYRTIIRVIAQTREAISLAQRRITKAQKTLTDDEKRARDVEETTAALRARIQELETAAAEAYDEHPDDEERREAIVAAKIIKDTDVKIKELTKKTRSMMVELRKITNDLLAPMLAVEEMGGPVVGALADVDVLKDIINGDANLDGTAKKKGGKGKKALERGQRRIDEVWGRKGGDDDDEDEEIDPIKAAADEVLQLVQELMNNSLSNASLKYTDLPRDSAAARFLVRSFVATLHPSNALKIRLIEFGRGIEDG